MTKEASWPAKAVARTRLWLVQHARVQHNVCWGNCERRMELGSFSPDETDTWPHVKCMAVRRGEFFVQVRSRIVGAESSASHTSWTIVAREGCLPRWQARVQGDAAPVLWQVARAGDDDDIKLLGASQPRNDGQNTFCVGQWHSTALEEVVLPHTIELAPIPRRGNTTPLPTCTFRMSNARTAPSDGGRGWAAGGPPLATACLLVELPSAMGIS